MIVVDGVTVEVGGQVILRPVSFEVADGAVLAVVGPSGSGKSTLLGCVSGLLVPSAGAVEVAGRAMAGGEAQRARLRREHLGVVSQDADLLDELDVVENVALPLIFAGRGRAEAMELAVAALTRVGCESLAQARPGTLSGGEAQRVAVARALTVPGRAIVADEPTAALDRRNALSVGALVVDNAREQGSATLVATHDLELAAMCDEVLDLRAVEVGAA